MERSAFDNTAGQNVYGGDPNNGLADVGNQRYTWKEVSEVPNEMNPLAATMSTPFTDAFAQSLVPKAAVSYLRVSTRDQAYRGGEAEGFSIPAQREANKRKAASLGAIVIKEFVDRGASAKSANRPELQKMLEYVAENQVDFVIVHKVDRLARNREDDVEINKALGKAGVRLVSTTESIDETPSGMLLHGIMSSIAEFYSRNLANEVIKGMTQKARSGGTISKAPLGYRNVRTVDAEGREMRTVVVDEERGPLVRRAFELYATGKWTVAGLADHLADRGLSTVNTPRVPSKPIIEGNLNKLLVNPYYKGCVTFQGAVYPGKHEALIDELTWQQVQDILTTHASGERTRDHPHYLKSTVYCATCGSRLVVQISKSKTGMHYPYFMCAGRHAKRTDCRQKAVLIEEVERRVEEYYEHMAMDPEFRQHVEALLVDELRSARAEAETEMKDLGRERDRLERERDKLMQAHYEGAIPVDLLKREQDRIASGLLVITAKLEASNLHFDVVEANLKAALDLTENCGLAYKTAPDHVRRQFNQVFFKRILVGADTKVEPELAPPFDTLLGPELRVLGRQDEGDTSDETNEPTQTSGLIALDQSNRRTRRRVAFPHVQGLSNELLVPPREFES
ncbi:MAG: recombinase family protein [Actinobacteria bacterium HGW-Actinobacteria-10]|nr:MAG: recombinase family protein [Actinobacteria bacterium HGW-Actinobacteria-10]